MLADVDAGRISAIVVYHGDRLVRQPFDLETLINLAYGKGIKLASPTGTRDLSNDDDLFILRIEVAAQCRESAATSRRVKSLNARRRRAGLTRPGGTGGRTLCFETDGVTHRPADRCVIATREEIGEVDFIREAAGRLLGGESQRSVLADLTARSLRSTAGNVIRQSAFRRTLLLPRMAGLMPDGEQEAAWEPVIDRDRWEMLRTLLDSHPANDWAGRGALYLLSGIAECDRCGHPMYAGERKSSAYKCPQSGGCGNNRRDRIHLDTFVIAAVCARLQQPGGPVAATPTTPGLAAEYETLRSSRRETEAMIADHASGPRLPLLMGRLDSLDRRMAELRELSGGGVRAQLLAQYAGTTEPEFRALPLAVQRSLASAAFTVRVLPASRRGPGFNPDDVVLVPR
jgi:hypothetical protein